MYKNCTSETQAHDNVYLTTNISLQYLKDVHNSFKKQDTQEYLKVTPLFGQYLTFFVLGDFDFQGKQLFFLTTNLFTLITSSSFVPPIDCSVLLLKSK